MTTLDIYITKLTLQHKHYKTLAVFMRNQLITMPQSQLITINRYDYNDNYKEPEEVSGFFSVDGRLPRLKLRLPFTKRIRCKFSFNVHVQFNQGAYPG